MTFYISLVVVMMILNYKLQGWLTWIIRPADDPQQVVDYEEGGGALTRIVEEEEEDERDGGGGGALRGGIFGYTSCII